jgi:hypothetical protein
MCTYYYALGDSKQEVGSVKSQPNPTSLRFYRCGHPQVKAQILSVTTRPPASVCWACGANGTPPMKVAQIRMEIILSTMDELMN